VPLADKFAAMRGSELDDVGQLEVLDDSDFNDAGVVVMMSCCRGDAHGNQKQQMPAQWTPHSLMIVPPMR
jgi:hypothetical protein